jgi:hypothetical protein
MNLMAMCSIGIDFMYRQITGDLRWDDRLHAYVFTTNSICPIGSDPLRNDTYISFRWWWHAISTVNGEPFTPEARVWDPTAAQKLNLRGTWYRNPPADYPPGGHLWPLREYWYTGSTLGLVASPQQGPNAPYQPYPLRDGKCGVGTMAGWIPPDWRNP